MHKEYIYSYSFLPIVAFRLYLKEFMYMLEIILPILVDVSKNFCHDL